MSTEMSRLWRGPTWLLAALLALLGMLGPFVIDAYLPAFGGIAASTGATPTQMQQTLSAYLFAFAFMNLFHGALSDSFGRRPVVLVGLAVFTLASVGCALSQTIGQLIFFRALQGLSTGAGIVVSRAVVRDLFGPSEAQKTMAQITIFFGVAPVIAPMVGGLLYAHWGWRAVFGLLVTVGLVLLAICWRMLPETLPAPARQPLKLRNLMGGYRALISDPRFLLLALASGVPFNGMFLYVLSAPAFLGDVLGLAPTQFFWFFVINMAGIMGGSWLSGRKAGRVAPKRQIRDGFLIMLLAMGANLLANALLAPSAWWAFLPLMVYSFGWALMVPVVTLMVLDLAPARRGMASSLQAVVASVSNGVVAGVLAPLVMHSATGMAWMASALMATGLIAWIWVHHRWPELGRTSAVEV